MNARNNLLANVHEGNRSLHAKLLNRVGRSICEAPWRTAKEKMVQWKRSSRRRGPPSPESLVSEEIEQGGGTQTLFPNPDPTSPIACFIQYVCLKEKSCQGC
ncbi:unnamed protein product [Ectocarpus sp. 12 AP-2014]